MAFDPVRLLRISMALAARGASLRQAWRDRHAGGLPRWSGAAFLSLGVGFGLVLAAPTDIHAPVRVLGNAVVMLSYGLFWAAARAFDGRRVTFEPVVAGALSWLVAASVFDPSQAVRIGLTSAIVASYSFAAAWEFVRGPCAGVPSRRRAAWIFAAHGTFFLLRMVLGPTFGLAPWGPDVAGVWGALMGAETALAAALAGVALATMTRERDARPDGQEPLEDPLTGIGNRRALFHSGRDLIDAARAAGRPAALLLMDLDAFGTVNDLHGRPVGDRLLVAFAHLAHEYLPPNGLVCRIGGETFAAVLPGADPERARAVADEIRALFAYLVLHGPHGPVRTTVSIGVVQADGGGADRSDAVGDLLDRAERCLRAAKLAGRDRVVGEGDPSLAAAGRRSAA